MCKEAKLLLLISSIFTLTMGLSSIFVNVFFWRETRDFSVIAIYHLMQYIFTPLAFVVAGYVAKRKNGIWALRIGLMVYAFFYLLILFIGNKGVGYIYILGSIYGIACGFYWLAFNTLSFDFTSVDNRDSFNGFNGSCNSFAGIIAPITSAYIINRYQGTKGYNIVFMLTLGLFVVLILISSTLRCRKCGSKLKLKVAFSRNNHDWTVMRKAIMLWGFRDVIIVFIMNILIFQNTGSELSLGKLALIGGFISTLSYVLVQRIIKPKRRILSIYIGAISALVSITILFIKINYITLLFYMIIDSFFIPFFIIQLWSTTFNVIDRSHEEDLRIEYMINKDIVLNFGRVVSTIILIVLLTLFKNPNIIKNYLLFIGITPLLSACFLVRLKNILSGEK